MASSDDQARFSFSNSQIQSEIPFFFFVNSPCVPSEYRAARWRQQWAAGWLA